MKTSRNSYACKYRMAWVLVFFDLPVLTPEQRREAAGFRKDLIKEGFMMVQYSVYARPCQSADRVDSQLRRIKALLPAQGEVRALTLTDAQWGRMAVFHSGKKKAAEDMPEQLLLFCRPAPPKHKPPPRKRFVTKAPRQRS
jgi:CRISPR-associated protein Cas2